MASPFRPALELLAQYAECHRDRRNILTHFIGVPMIVFAVGVLLARPTFVVGGWALSPAWAAFTLASAWYLTRGRLGIGLATVLGVGLLMVLAHQASAASGDDLAAWLGWGVGCFGVGWVIQFLGHYYEGRKPAFADDLMGLLVGPMFVVLEMLALAGMFRGLVDEIEGRVGPTHLRDLAQPLAR